MKAKIILTIVIILSLLLIFTLPGNSQTPIQVKIDSVKWEGKSKAIVYGKTLSGELVECAFGFSKNTGRELKVARWITILEINGRVRDGRKRSKIKLND